ncbi:hypothetical protein WOLCODRAFT_27356 [Wolfiporia cocos MD-104 SS10]|uniref:Uncharacterized protein n=1 Tax=Wolfiporia cocos (strain MD-104) TaxID=742152 RepID=A0A2H3JD93_WOLCO|nr:hypothetical protein WOLCODRAFT_27356 [Wolfiporia cocos MD-104 SS10]
MSIRLLASTNHSDAFVVASASVCVRRLAVCRMVSKDKLGIYDLVIADVSAVC